MASTGSHTHLATRRKLIIPLILAVVSLAGVAYFYFHRAPAFTEKDTIMLADFDNKTGDTVFDDTLKQALTVDLQQSPYFSVVSQERVAQTLKLMRRAADQRITGEVARDLCQRVGSKALLTGSIVNLDGDYAIGLNAVNCDTGDSVALERLRARSKSDVLKALDEAASTMRAKLGESLPSVQKYDIPVAQATTPSLEALKAYSRGTTLNNADAVPFLKHAIELDPQFAAAYASLGVSYANLGQSELAIENFKRAYELRERTSERERLNISALYYTAVTEELEKANQQYRFWIQEYPRDPIPHHNLGVNYSYLGQHTNALAETREAFHLDPKLVSVHASLGIFCINLNRFDEAKAIFEEVSAQKPDDLFTHVGKYYLAFLDRDETTMGHQLAWAAGKPGVEDQFFSLQSDTEASHGRLRKAREFTDRAVQSAKRDDAKETAALWQANAALREAEFGNVKQAREAESSALNLSPNRDVRTIAALVLALIGDSAAARNMADKLSNTSPLSTTLQVYWLPTIRAEIELTHGKADSAIQLLQTSIPYEMGVPPPIGSSYPVYVRGQAFLALGNGTAASAEFHKILDNRGLVANFPLGSLAHLGLARAYVLEHEKDKAKIGYQDFFALWKDADADIPILKQAKAEYVKLQ